MVLFLRNCYLYVLVLIYAISVSVLHFGFLQPVSDSLSFALLFGLCFPLISWLLVRRSSPYIPDRFTFSGEKYIVSVLVLFIVWYISYGTGWINHLVSKNILDTPWKNAFFILFKKLCVFVIIPYFIYGAFGFRPEDFGFSVRRPGKKVSRTILVFLLLSICMLVFQLFIGRGAEPLRRGQFTISQLLYGLPLCFLWYVFEVGLVEEFFFSEP